MAARPKTGDAAPDFEGSATTDPLIRLKDYVGKKNVVLYFYPKDDTKGCTIEACSFRDKLQSIASLWTEVIGISVDTVDSHKKFAEKNNLNFPLISDHDKRISNAYGVLSKDGSRTERITFVIGKDGRIAKVFTDVDVTKHTHEVVETLKQLPLGKTKS